MRQDKRSKRKRTIEEMQSRRKILHASAWCPWLGREQRLHQRRERENNVDGMPLAITAPGCVRAHACTATTTDLCMSPSVFSFQCPTPTALRIISPSEAPNHRSSRKTPMKTQSSVYLMLSRKQWRRQSTGLARVSQ